MPLPAGQCRTARAEPPLALLLAPGQSTSRGWGQRAEPPPAEAAVLSAGQPALCQPALCQPAPCPRSTVPAGALCSCTSPLPTALTCILREEADTVEGGKARSATSSSGSKTCRDRAQRMLEPAGIGSVLPAGHGAAALPGSPAGPTDHGRGSQPAGLGCSHPPSDPPAVPRAPRGWMDAAAQGQLGGCLSSPTSLSQPGKRVPRGGCEQGSRT